MALYRPRPSVIDGPNCTFYRPFSPSNAQFGIQLMTLQCSHETIEPFNIVLRVLSITVKHLVALSAVSHLANISGVTFIMAHSSHTGVAGNRQIRLWVERNGVKVVRRMRRRPPLLLHPLPLQGPKEMHH